MRIASLQFILAGLLMAFAAGCKGKAEPVRKPPPVNTQPPTPVVVAPKEKQVYVYSGDRFRDPFVPAGQSSAYQADAIFDPQRATLKGVIFGGQQKGAVLNVGGAGTYFVKEGRIIDIMGKYVEGYTVKVMVNKVIITSSDDSTYELRLKGLDEEAKPL